MRHDVALGGGRHLLSVADLGAEGIAEVMRVTDSFVEVSARAIPKVPILRGKTVASVFYEDSTRTRLSFEKAAKALSADVMAFSASGSSVKKGESLRDTVLTIEAMGVDAVVVRHRSAGVPRQVAGWLDASGGDVAVVNAGDGWHEHPTQALLDCYTVRQARREAGAADAGDLRGLSVAIVGDVAHSRVARSNVAAFAALGAGVTLVAPRTFLPPSLEGWPVSVADDLDAVLPTADVVYLLRVQRERTEESLVPTLREYTARYGLTRRRAGLLREGAVVMHPGPMNRGVEIAAEVADLPASLVARQVANGVAVRMAVLFLLLSGPSATAAEPAAVPEGAEPRDGTAPVAARLALPEGAPAAGAVLAGAADGGLRRAGPRLPPTAARAPQGPDRAEPALPAPAGADDGPARG